MSPFSRVPHAVYDALERNMITQLQFVILSWLHKWADYRTGCIRGFRAGSLCRVLHISITKASLRAMQREVSILRQAGWFHWNYQHGRNKPFDVWLHNYQPMQPSSYRFKENNLVAEHLVENVAEQSVLNPCEIRSYQEAADFDVAGDVAEERDSLSLNAHRTVSSRSTDEGEDDDSVGREAADLLAFIWEHFHRTRPKNWAKSIVKQYPLLEIKYALVEFLYCGYEPSDPAINFFLKDDQIHAVILSRRNRYGDPKRPALQLPAGWAKVQAAEQDHREDADREAREMKLQKEAAAEPAVGDR